MRHPVISFLGAVVAASLCLAPSAATAQVRFGYPGGGYYSRPNIYTSPAYGGYGGSGGYGGYGYGGLGYGGYRGGYSPYAASPYGYGYGGYRDLVPPVNYGYGAYDPRVYGYGGAPVYGTTTGFSPRWNTYSYASGLTAPRMRESFHPAGAVNVAGESPAWVTVTLPSADAEVWFQGAKTSQTGTQRLYESPPLKTGTEYTYQIRARWRSGSMDVEQTRSVAVRAGEHPRVDFSAK